MDNDINREINIEQVEFGIDIENAEYTIEINPRDTFAVELNEQGPQGARGYTGNGISSYELTSSSGLTDTYTITFTDGNTTTVNVTNGRGITSITGPVSVGNVDTYTINYNDSTTSTFIVTNGIDGVNPTVTVGSTTTGLPGTNASVVNTGTTQDVILDFTIPRGDKGDTGTAATITVGTVTTGLPTDPASVTNVGTSGAAIFDFTIPKGDKGDTGATGNGVSGVTKISTVGLVDTYRMAFTDGSHFDYPVTNGRDGTGAVTDVTVNGISVLDGSVAKVIVPTDTGDLTNNAGYIKGITSGDITTALGYTPYNSSNPNGYITASALNGYATETYVDNGLATKQATLVSGTNIKTINNNSILGSGDLTLDSLPSQTGQSGKFLTTDGTDASWGNLPIATSSSVGVIKPDNASIRVSNDGTLSAICRNVGEIIQSTLPLTDAGLHLLDGSLILGGGIYQGFVDYIADLYTNNPSANYFTTEALWQQSVTDYGVCGKFVYDSVNNTVRLPKITGIIEGTVDVTALGDLVEAGLPNITGSFGLSNYNGTSYGLFSSGGRYSGAFYQGDATQQSAAPQNSTGRDAAFDASLSSSIYGNSSTVQPQTIKAFYYIVIATSTKTDIQVDIDEVVTDLNGKADVDLTNINNTGKIAIAHNAMPSNTFIDLTLGASGTIYTAPADGYVTLYKVAGGTYYFSEIILLDDNDVGMISDFREAYSTSPCTPTLAVKKGQKFKVNYNAYGATNWFRFIYAQGSESEAS